MSLRTVTDQATLEALRDAFWPFYLFAMAAGTVSFTVSRRWCLGRAVIALVCGSLAQFAWEAASGTYLAWWQHMVIDVPILVLVTLPPRHYWQSTLGGLIFAQLFFHAVWGMAPDLAREHWLGTVLIGFVKCGVIILWAGGKRVEDMLRNIARPFAGLVLAPCSRELAK